MPTVERVSSSFTYSSKSRWTPPGDGHTDPLSHEFDLREASSTVKADATFHATSRLQGPQAKWHNMAASDVGIAQTPHAELVRVASHVRHLLSKELFLRVLKTLLLELFGMR